MYIIYAPTAVEFPHKTRLIRMPACRTRMIYHIEPVVKRKRTYVDNRNNDKT